MNANLEILMYDASQLFLAPVLLAIAALFLYAFHACGAFLWQAWQRRLGLDAGFELIELHRANAALEIAELEAVASQRLEVSRIATRVAPMLGLVATMIPMGPALKALGDGQLADVSHSLMVAFSAVILALIAAALTFWAHSVRRRWYAVDLLVIEKGLPPAAGPAAMEAAR